MAFIRSRLMKTILFLGLFLSFPLCAYCIDGDPEPVPELPSTILILAIGFLAVVGFKKTLKH
jgi:hypothetical protein